MPDAARKTGPAVIVAAGLATLGFAAVGPSDRLGVRSGCLLLGFLLLLAGFLLHAPASIAGYLAACFAFFGGISALRALDELQTSADELLRLAEPMIALGFLSVPTELGLAPGYPAAFDESLALTAVAGALTCLVAWAIEHGPRPRLTLGTGGVVPRSIDVERLGKLFVAVGFVGLALAMVRFVRTGLPGASGFEAVKSFWEGGSYLLLLAHLALPGFALWFASLVERRAPRADWLRAIVLLVVLLAAFVPTAQRTFAIEAGGVLLLVGVLLLRVRVRWLVAIAAIGIVVLGATQAFRNELRETGTITAAGLRSRLAPSQLPTLYGSQVASFKWTVESVRFKQDISVDQPLGALISKPVPGALYPDKPAGFSEQFTTQLHPDAARDSVYFATPLVAEAYSSAGWPGVLLAHALLGALLGLGAAVVRRGVPRVLLPACVMALLWTGFVVLRGDLANAAFVASGWVLPVLAAIAWSAYAARPSRRVVLDLLDGDAVETLGPLVGPVATAARAGGVPSVVVRTSRAGASALGPRLPEGVGVETPWAGSAGTLLRRVYRHVVAPSRDSARSIVVATADGAPLWGRAYIVEVSRARNGSGADRSARKMLLSPHADRSVAPDHVAEAVRDRVGPGRT